MTCEFCAYHMNIEPQRIVYEDEDYMAFVSKEPIVNGHCIIMPKEHAEFVTGLPDVKRFFILISYLCQAIKDAVGADHVRIETRYPHSSQIKHTHVHLVPSFNNDEAAKAAKAIKNADERILENLRKSQWYSTLNR